MIVVAPQVPPLTPAQWQALVAALVRIEATSYCPDYLRDAAAPLLSK